MQLHHLQIADDILSLLLQRKKLSQFKRQQRRRYLSDIHKRKSMAKTLWPFKFIMCTNYKIDH